MENIGLMYEIQLPEPLSQEELMDYFRKYHSGDQTARNIIVERNLRLLILILKEHFARELKIYQEDIVSIASIGLIKAVDTFDISENNKVRFGTYASRCMINEVLNFKRYHECDKRGKNCVQISLYQHNSIGTMLLENIIDENQYVEEIYLEKEQFEIIRKLVLELPERDRKIIILYFGLFGHTPLTAEEIAPIVGITRQRVSQIIKRKLEEIKEKLKILEFVSLNESEQEQKNCYAQVKEIVVNGTRFSPIIKKVLILYFGFDDNNPLNIDQIAEKLKHCYAQIRSLLENGIQIIMKELTLLGIDEVRVKEIKTLARQYRKMVYPVKNIGIDKNRYQQ